MGKNQGKKDDVMDKLIVLGSALGGGVVANQGSNFLEKQTWLGEYAAHAPAIPALLGAIGFVLIPQKDTMTKAAGSFCLGMAITGGTEEIEVGIGALKGALGYTPQQIFGLGFTAQLKPEQFMKNAQYVNGIPVR